MIWGKGNDSVKLALWGDSLEGSLLRGCGPSRGRRAGFGKEEMNMTFQS